MLTGWNAFDQALQKQLSEPEPDTKIGEFFKALDKAAPLFAAMAEEEGRSHGHEYSQLSRFREPNHKPAYADTSDFSRRDRDPYNPLPQYRLRSTDYAQKATSPNDPKRDDAKTFTAPRQPLQIAQGQSKSDTHKGNGKRKALGHRESPERLSSDG